MVLRSRHLRAHAHNSTQDTPCQDACARTLLARMGCMPADDVDRVAAWAALLRVHAAVVPKLERELAARQMPLAWYDVLLVLNAAPGRRLRMTEVGARAVLSRERV